MNLRNQKKLSAKILKTGKHKVAFSPDGLSEIKEAITRADLKSLIKKGLITKKKSKGVSRGRKREQRKKKKTKGMGKRKGTYKTRNPKKRMWINKVRPQRRLLKLLKKKGVIASQEFKRLYALIKGNFFRSVNHLKLYLNKMKEKQGSEERRHE